VSAGSSVLLFALWFSFRVWTTWFLAFLLFACRGSKLFAGICLTDQHEKDPGWPPDPDRSIRLNKLIAASMNLFAGASDYTA
jgi:hypothetical protein